MEKTPKEVFGHRLRQARLMAGLSLRQLSEKIGEAVSHAALAKYEKGQTMPNSTVVLALAEALHQSATFFFRPPVLELKDVRFRKKARLSKEMEEAVKERALDFFERYHQAEEIVGDVKRYQSPFRSQPIDSPEQAEEKADQLRASWGLGVDPIPSVHELLEIKGIKIYEVETEDTHFDGFSAETDAGPVMVMASWLSKNLPRKRMTAVHELAHIVLKIAPIVDTKGEEAIANRFAGAFLLPRTTFSEQFGNHRKAISLGELIKLKMIFGVSICGIMMRAAQLGLIDRAMHERFWQRFGNRWRAEKKEDGDELYRGEESLSRFHQLVLRAAAEDLVTQTAGAALLNISLMDFRSKLRGLCA